MLFYANLDARFEEWYKKQNPVFLGVEKISPADMDIQNVSDAYMESSNSADVSFDANANNDGYMKSPNDHYFEMFSGLRKLKNYASLYKICADKYGIKEADEAFTAVIDGDIYIHDSSYMNVPYCFAFSSSRLMTEGRYWAGISTAIPKYASSFISQVIETVIEMSNEFAGAIAVSDLLINYAWYAYNEKLSVEVIEQDLQRFIYTVNGKFRATQPPFVNISLFDNNNINIMFKDHVYPDMTKPFAIIDTINFIQDIFMNLFKKGDAKGKPFRFPVVTTNFLVDKANKAPLDSLFMNKVCKSNYEKGVFNVYVTNGVGKLASCCRLVSDFTALKGADSFGNGGISIGSHRVVSINLPRIGLIAKDEAEYFELLNDQIAKCEKLLVSHRELIKKRAKQGCLKFLEPIKYVNVDRMLFSTIGIMGVFESAVNFGHYYSENHNAEVYSFMGKVLSHIRAKVDALSIKHGVGFNVEQVPGESLAYKFVQKDRLKFGHDAVPYEFYSNQFIPLTFDMDVFDRMVIDGKFSKLLSGGGITHMNFSDKFQSPDQMARIIDYAIECGLEHFAIEQMQSECEDHHITVGNFEHCPICDKNIIEKYVRVVGYRVPLSSINKIRRIYDVPNRKYQTSDKINYENKIA